MATIQLKNYQCNYEFLNHNKAKTIVFSNSLGTDYTMWKEVVHRLSDDFNILLHDTRGHGQSSNTAAALQIGELADDIVELLDQLNIKNKITFCGLSMGGLIGQHLGIYYPERFDKLILANTAPKIGTDVNWNTRIDTVTANGLNSILEGTAERWFTQEFKHKNEQRVQSILVQFAANDLQGYCANCAAVRDADYRSSIHKIEIPVLIIAGKYDLVTTVHDAELMQEQIPNAQLCVLEAAHLSAVECVEDFALQLLSF